MFVAVSGNFVAVFGDYSFGNNLLPFSAILLLVWTGLYRVAQLREIQVYEESTIMKRLLALSEQIAATLTYQIAPRIDKKGLVMFASLFM